MKIIKKIISVFSATALVAACTISASAYVCKQGDANADGTFDVNDATVIQQYLANDVQFKDMNKVAAEVDGDGVVSISDATFIQRKLASLDAQPDGFVPMDGIDVSDWQGANVNFEKIKADGYEFVILRAGYGNEISQKDKRFEQYYAGAKAAGLKVGAYWYSYADGNADAVLEAQTFKTAIAGKSFEMPLFLDVEDKMHLNYSKELLTSITNTFCQTMAQSNYFVGIYSNQYFFNNLLDLSNLTYAKTVWLAEYDNTMNIECDVWQYASDGTVNGVYTDCDMNKCLVDYPTIITIGGYNGF